MTALKQYQLLEAEGRYFDGQTAQPRDVIVKFGDASLMILDLTDMPITHWPLATLRSLGAAGPGLSLIPDHGADERLTVTDGEMIKAIRAVCPRLEKAEPVGGRRWTRVAAWATLAVGSIYVIIFHLLPALSDQLAELIPPEAEAAMAEPLAVTLHAVRQAGGILGRRVLVTGCGPIGVLTILAARRAGAGEIIATDLADRALEFARKAGADVVLNTASNPEALAPYCGGKGSLDILFECSGAQQALAGGIAALRPGGRIVQLGLSGDMTLPMMQITAKELSLVGSFRFHEEFAVAVRMMQGGLIDVKPLVTHNFPLADYSTAFATAADRTQAMKVQLEFGPC